MPLHSGEVFAGFTIVRLLGSGGMGEVYLAEHPRLPRHDALKILPSGISADRDFRQRFEREADLASTLWHPHIVGVHDRGESDGQLWISMDFVDGLDAARKLAEAHPSGMPVGEVVKIVTAVANALDYAHKRGLLHRDVKPGNIMLADADDDGEQRILLTDFGIARDVNEISGLTATNMTVGTVAYSAPEQLMGDEITGRADQYALAATAYHLLSGSLLFPHSNPAVVIGRHLNAAPPSIAETRPELAALDAVLAVALAKDPNDRFSRCTEFAHALAEQVSPPEYASHATPTHPASAARRTPPNPPGPVAVHPDESAGTVGLPYRGLLVGVATVMALAGVVGAALAGHPWTGRDTPTPVSSLTASTTIRVAPVITPPLPPPVFAASDIDAVLLKPSEIANMTSDRFRGYSPDGNLEVLSSSLGMSDNAFAIDPPDCAGVIFGAEQRVYADSGYQAIRDQTFGKDKSNIDGLVEQTAVVFPTAAQAQARLSASTAQWRKCANGHPDPDPRYPAATQPEYSIGQDAGYEKGWGWYLDSVDVGDDMITLRMSAVDNLNGNAPACQLALGVRANVMVKTKTCLETNTGPNRPPASLAGNYAQRLATAMLDKIEV